MVYGSLDKNYYLAVRKLTKPTKYMNISLQILHRYILLILALFSPLLLSAVPPEMIRFEEMRSLENFPNNEVLDLFQDSDGFIWIATSRGLYSYDGYNIDEYKANIYRPNLFNNNRITTVGEDLDKRIYVGTNNGLAIIDKRTGGVFNSLSPMLQDNIVTAIKCIDRDDVWLATERGVMRYNPTTDSCVRFNPTSNLLTVVKSLFQDSRGYLWFGTWSNGLTRYDIENDEFFVYPQINQQNSAHVIYEDSYNRIWVGGFGYGLTLLSDPYDMDRVSYKTYTMASKPKSVTDDYIFDICENRETNSLWVGTRNGVTIIPMNIAEEWIDIHHDNSPHSLPSNEIDAIISDNEGNVWVGGIGGGVRCVKTRGHFIKSVIPGGKTINSVRSIYVDDKENIWSGIGSIGLALQSGSGASRLFDIGDATLTDNFIRVNHIAQSSKTSLIWFATSLGVYIYDNNSSASPFRSTLLLDHVKSSFIHYDKYREGFWVATIRGLYYIDEKSREVKQKIILKKDYTSICQSDSNTLWVGTESNGIIRVSLDQSGEIINQVVYNTYNEKLPCTEVMALYTSKDSRVWAGTNGGGLCLYNTEKDIFESINEISNFPTDLILSIVEDRDGTLWMGSNIGLIKFLPSENLENSDYRCYNKANGMPDNLFLPNAVSMDKDGNIYFGTYKGYIYFDPTKLVDYNLDGRLFITDIKVNNRDVSTLDSLEQRRISPYTIGYSESINIPYKYTNFTFEFVPMSYFNPDNVRYAYKLEGYDSEWRFATGYQRFAHYANLPYGRYTFNLRSTTDDGMWSDNVKKIKVRVIAPPYLRWWAKLIYALLLITVIIIIYRSVKQRIALNTTIKLQQINQEKSEAVNHSKLRFFTNITHELFIPITIVAAAMEDNKGFIPSRNYEVIMSNINRLTRLIQQILEFRKAETGNLKLYVSRQNITEFVEKNIESFIPLMKKKHIEIIAPKAVESKEGYIDTDKIDKIIYNLLSNALKYNVSGATVEVMLEYPEDRNSVIISVKDNGKGMSERAMKNLFKRFYDGDFRRFNTTGTGIGLSLVHDLVTLHKGKIDVDNHPGKGVTFIIEVPIDANSYSEEECYESELVDVFCVEPEEIIVPSAPEESEEGKDEVESQYTVLIVEDNPDLLLVLSSSLSKVYKTLTATDGQEALKIIKRDNIDIVVSDVMMPNMNGYELCREIKKSRDYNHIPVIILTAKQAKEDAVDGYNSGADSIITKPASLSVLYSRINNLLMARATRIKEFKEQSVYEPEALHYASYDEEFLSSIIKLITDNFAEPEFDQNRLAELAGMSKSTLHRKLKSLTGMTASTLIKETRMKCAHDMLFKHGHSRISEVAYAVGFNDPKYFSICFKKMFGYPPSDPPAEISQVKPKE